MNAMAHQPHSSLRIFRWRANLTELDDISLIPNHQEIAMSRFPKIETRCPLASEELQGLNGHCKRCNTTVHSLDGLSDGERATFMRKATGSMCVTYSIAASVAAVMALSMVSPARAQDTAPAAAPMPASVQTAKPASYTEPQTGTLIHKPTDLDGVVVIAGAVHSPGDAQWVDDDSSVPELPMARERDDGKH
jgi:hypothetical protein